jgi:hypothetical protein
MTKVERATLAGRRSLKGWVRNNIQVHEFVTTKTLRKQTQSDSAKLCGKKKRGIFNFRKWF